jgi:hypothetical protein
MYLRLACYIAVDTEILFSLFNNAAQYRWIEFNTLLLASNRSAAWRCCGAMDDCIAYA